MSILASVQNRAQAIAGGIARFFSAGTRLSTDGQSGPIDGRYVPMAAALQGSELALSPVPSPETDFNADRNTDGRPPTTSVINSPLVPQSGQHSRIMTERLPPFGERLFSGPFLVQLKAIEYGCQAVLRMHVLRELAGGISPNAAKSIAHLGYNNLIELHAELRETHGEAREAKLKELLEEYDPSMT